MLDNVVFMLLDIDIDMLQAAPHSVSSPLHWASSPPAPTLVPGGGEEEEAEAQALLEEEGGDEEEEEGVFQQQ